MEEFATGERDAMSDTPRTDEFWLERKRRPSDTAWLKYARTLERELAEVMARFAEADKRMSTDRETASNE